MLSLSHKSTLMLERVRERESDMPGSKRPKMIRIGYSISTGRRTTIP